VSAAGTALFNAHEQMVVPATVQLGSALLTTVAGAALLLAGHGIVALGWVSLGVNFVAAAVFAAACARRFFPLGAAIRPAAQRALAGESLPLMINNLLNSVFFRFDVQVLQSRGSAVVGYYTSAYKVIDAAGTVPSSFVLALFPLLSRRAAERGPGADGLARVYRLALKLLVAVALPVALLVTYWARDLTQWLWGPEFLPDSAIALALLIWFLPLSFFNGLTQYVLIALGLQRRITAAFAVTAVFNVGANLLLVPRYSYVAAALITIASEVVLLVPFLFAVRRRVPVGPLLRAALRPVPAAMGMGAVLWGGGAWSPPGATLAAAAAYPLLLFATATFDSSERHALRGLLSNRRGPG
jgi:O-antigen/teichoic acid export membrane protein